MRPWEYIEGLARLDGAVKVKVTGEVCRFGVERHNGRIYGSIVRYGSDSGRETFFGLVQDAAETWRRTVGVPREVGESAGVDVDLACSRPVLERLPRPDEAAAEDAED